MTTIKLRGDTAANLAAINRVYAEREVILDLTNKNFRVGDGVTTWSSLVDWIQGVSSSVYASIVIDEKNTGVHGGTFTSGAWRTRDINTILRNDLGISVSNNQMNVPSGNYLFMSVAPCYAVGTHQSRLYDVTSVQAILNGHSNFSRTGSYGTADISIIFGYINLSQQSMLELQHQCQVTQVTNGFGHAASFSNDKNVYSQVCLIGL